MKLNEIDFDLLSNKELVEICLKYKLLEKEQIVRSSRKDILQIIKQWIHKKLQVYGQNKNIKSISVNNRRNSISGNIQKNQLNYVKSNGPPKASKVRQRRLSQPTTVIEKKEAVEFHSKNKIREQSQNQLKQEIKSLNPKYDIIGMYPPVKKLIAIGDLHGDLRVTLIALKLA